MRASARGARVRPYLAKVVMEAMRGTAELARRERDRAEFLRPPLHGAMGKEKKQGELLVVAGPRLLVAGGEMTGHSVLKECVYGSRPVRGGRTSSAWERARAAD